MQELAVMNVDMRLITENNLEHIQSLTRSPENLALAHLARSLDGPQASATGTQTAKDVDGDVLADDLQIDDKQIDDLVDVDASASRETSGTRERASRIEFGRICQR